MESIALQPIRRAISSRRKLIAASAYRNSFTRASRRSLRRTKAWYGRKPRINEDTIMHKLTPKILLAGIAAVFALSAQEPTCRRCPATYIDNSELQAYAKRAIDNG